MIAARMAHSFDCVPFSDSDVNVDGSVGVFF